MGALFSLFVVDNVDEMYIDPCMSKIGEFSTVMDEFRDFFQTQFFSTFAKHKHHGVDHIGFTTTVGSYDSVETMVHWTDCFFSGIGFEVFKLATG